MIKLCDLSIVVRWKDPAEKLHQKNKLKYSCFHVDGLMLNCLETKLYAA